MWRNFSTFALIGAMGVCLNLGSTGAMAQTTEPVEAAPLEWQPQDKRPPWSLQEDLDAATEPGWRPGDGKPGWAGSSQQSVGTEAVTGQPSWAGRPAWVDRPTSTQGLGAQRSLQAKSLQSTRGGVASGVGNRGKGRK